MTTETAGRAIAHVLEHAGVDRVFGVPGESFLGLLDALHDAPIEYVATRHEGGGAFMASGYARAGRTLGVCSGTRAVGAMNLGIGIHTARQDSTAMLAFAGQVPRAHRGREAFQEIDLVAAFAPLCKWTVELEDAGRAAHVVTRAIEVATMGRPGPVLVSLPEDVLEEQVAPPRPPAAPPSPATPDRDELQAALDDLTDARRPVILAGGGVLAADACAELVQLAEAVEMPVITAWRRDDVFPNDHRLFLGSASLGQPRTVYDRMAEADVVLAVGTRFQEVTTDGYRVPGPDSVVHAVDLDPRAPGRPAGTRSVVADAGVALRMLLELSHTVRHDTAERRARNHEDRQRYLEQVSLRLRPLANRTVDPARVIAALQRFLPDNGIVSTDAGNFASWLARYFTFRRPGTFLGPTSGAMGYALPAAIGAKLARPRQRVVALAGDGGFLMTGTELEVAVRHDAPVVAVVFDNQQYGTIRMHQEMHHPGRPVGTSLTSPDFAAFAGSFGIRSWSISDDDDVDGVIREAFEEDAPALVHVHVDPRRVTAASDRIPPAGAQAPQ